MTHPGIILDRDGTLIDFYRDPELGIVTPAFHPDHIRFLPGVIDGLRALAQAGFTLAIATNQPGAAKGQISLATIERVNRALIERLADHHITIAALAACTHHPEGGPGGDPALTRACDCRKPAPGLLQQLVRDLHLDPAATWMIGDTPTDMQAARSAGLRAAMLLDTRRCELCTYRQCPDSTGGPVPDLVAPRFDQLARALLAARAAQRS